MDGYEYSLSVSAVTCDGKTVELDETALEGLLTDATLNFSDATGAIEGDGLITLNVTSLGINSLTSDVVIDFSKMTCMGTDTALIPARGDIQGLNAGRTVGNLSGVSIQKDGKIVATYDNGDQRVIAQIAVANFTNLSGLEKAGDNLFSATLNSGEFDGIGDDITADGGYFTTGVVEMSNVDLAAEFTEMITTQRGYQANSRIITVSDTMLEELINLKR